MKAQAASTVAIGYGLAELDAASSKGESNENERAKTAQLERSVNVIPAWFDTRHGTRLMPKRWNAIKGAALEARRGMRRMDGRK